MIATTLIENKFSVVEPLSEVTNDGNGYIYMPYIPFTIGTIYNGKFSVSNEFRKYLEWRCVRNWDKKYYKYVNTWIDNVLSYQCDYFVKEMFHLIEQGLYKSKQL